MDRWLDEQINSNLTDVYICILQKHCAIYDIAWCIHDISWYVHLSIYDKTNIGRQTSRSRVPPSVRFRPHDLEGLLGLNLSIRTCPRHSKNQFLAFPQQTAIWCCFFLHLSRHNLQHQVKKNMQNITKPTEIWTKTLKTLTRVTSTHLFWPVSFKFNKSCYTSIS